MNVFIVFSVAFYFVSSYSANADKGFSPSNVNSFKGFDAYGFDGKKLNPFQFDINDVFTRFKVSILILSLLYYFSIKIFFKDKI
jgi:hypothetical protein